MACYNPLKAWTVEGVTTATGKMAISFREPPENVQEAPGFKWLQIPCGKCIGCRMDYSKQWAARMVEEATLYPNNAFLTLTYNNEHLPYSRTVDTKTGELTENHPLVKSHVVKFIKRLREKVERTTGAKLRYFACGEYGAKYGRPHYHMAVFNLDATQWGDIKLIGNNHQGDALFSSKEIERLWGKGFVTIGELTPQSAAYIARYMLKKQKGPDKKIWYEKAGLVQEYTSCSRKPGLGIEWYESNKETVYQNDCVYMPQRNKKPLRVKTPRYYDKLLEKENPEKLKRIKEAREKSQRLQQELKNARTTSTEWEQLKAAEKKAEDKYKALLRTYERG